MTDMLTRLGKLLRKSESTDSIEERDALIAKAQELASTYSIDLAIARRKIADSEQRQKPVMKRIVIGARGKVGLATYVELFTCIGGANNVKFDIATNSTAVWAYGFPEDIAMTEIIYATVLPQMIKDGDAFMRTKAYRNEQVYRKGTKKYTDAWGDTHRYVDWGWFPVAGRAARLHFHSAFALAVHRRLTEARRKAQESAKASTSGAELAIRAAEVEVTDMYKRESTAKGTWKGSTSSDGGTLSRREGKAAGQRASLGTESPIGGHRAAVTS